MPTETTLDAPETETISTLNSGSDAAAESSPANTDAKATGAESSPAQDAKPTESESSTERGAKEEGKPTLADAVKAALQKDQQPREKSPDSEDGKPAEETAKAEAKDEPAKAEAEDTKGKQDQSDVPFHKHPRWQEMVRREQALAQEVAALRKKAEIVAELERHTGSAEEFNALRNIVRLNAENPAAAILAQEKLLAQTKARALASEDLKRKVSDGLLDEETAMEVEQARRERALLAEQRQAEETQRTQQQRVAQQQAIAQALNTWEQATASKDPDYYKLEAEFCDRLTVMATQNYPTTGEEAAALASRAYKEVKERVERRLPSPKPIKPPLTDGSSRTARPAPKSFAEAIHNALHN